MLQELEQARGIWRHVNMVAIKEFLVMVILVVKVAVI